MPSSRRPVGQVAWGERMVQGILEASVQAGEGGAVIVLFGEADVTCQSQLSELLAGQLASGARHLSIDIAGLRFADVATIRTLVLAAETLKEREGHLVLLHPQRSVARVLELLGAEQVITIVTSTEATYR